MYRDIMVLKSKKNELVLNQHLINDLEIIKYDYRETVPGPGRYEPSYKLTKPKSYKYFIGEKFKTLTHQIMKTYYFVFSILCFIIAILFTIHLFKYLISKYVSLKSFIFYS